MAADGCHQFERGSDLSTARLALGGRVVRDAGTPGQVAPSKATRGRRLVSIADARERRLRDGRGPLRPRANREGPFDRPGVAARAAVPAGETGGGRVLARGEAGVSLPADDK